MKIKILLLFFLVFCLNFSCDKSKEQALIVKNQQNQNTKPNIIYILADDLGYGDLSCYGQTKFATPNIDNLADKGMLFTQHYSGSTVCAPSRSSLMTGQHTGNTPIRGNKSTYMGQLPLPENSFTIAELLKMNGYVTGAFGKWGLGCSSSEGDPLKQGFDFFFGYHDQKLAHHYYPYYLWDNNTIYTLKENDGLNKGQYAPEIIHHKALSFIKSNKNQPFFLYYPTIIPHAELFAPKTYMEPFMGKFDYEIAFKGIDEGEDYKKGRYGSQDYPRAAFAAMITLLDDQVGDIINLLKELGIEDNTIIIFTSDNGPHKEGGADPEYFDSNSIYRGYKRDLFEGGIRVPMLVKWPNKIKPGSKTNHVSAFWDVMPTIANIIDSKFALNTDGISFLPTLVDSGKQENHKYLYWEFHEKGGRQALRKDNFKLVAYGIKGNVNYQLFNLDTDPSERNNLAKEMPEKVKELKQIMTSTRTESKDFQF